MVNHLFQLSPDSDASLQQQIREQISKAIIGGHIPVNLPLPSTRKLAEMLLVSRNTVILAYEHLIDDGYIVSKARAGFYVDENILKSSVPDLTTTNTIEGKRPDWQRCIKVRSSSPKHNKILRWQDYRYPFIYGQLDPKMFPTNHWRECSRESMSVQSIRDWSSDRFDQDDALLIEQIHTRVLPRRGIWVDPEQILITIGSQHALYMTLRLLLDKDSTLGLEEPGYPDLPGIASFTHAKVQSLPIDNEGVVINERLDNCDLIYTTPSHQFPTTVTMTMQRRLALLKRASSSDFLIIEDDYECETTFASNPTPALKSLDTSDRVIYIGSLSKTLAPGLRLGYMVASKELINELREYRRMMLRHPPMNNQRSIALFMARGHHDSLIRNLVQVYEERWHELDTALQDYLPGSSTAPVFGGSAFWVQGPDSLDASELKKLALTHGIVLEPGQSFFHRDAKKNFFRLGYSAIATDRIRPGIKLLSELIKQIS